MFKNNVARQSDNLAVNGTAYNQVTPNRRNINKHMFKVEDQAGGGESRNNNKMNGSKYNFQEMHKSEYGRVSDNVDMGKPPMHNFTPNNKRRSAQNLNFYNH